ncbi:hypothetical protein [Glycomyces artemisiae]|uniref:Uncharacterized protein n=1 Tax=Glycomyces artemisiae TaxID=1076443 RepID=A0A2T0U6M7_9ACTN|nr:hypothetical protein [Glycomyces artemisiae]PRY53518.1 hypothetical protein B0I28_11717 [Glycomyces artemisiae]
MSETLNAAVRALNADLAVADSEVQRWPQSPRAYRHCSALLADLARAAEADGTEATAIAVAARVGADADAARAAELSSAARRQRAYTEIVTAIEQSADRRNQATPGAASPVSP